MSRRTASWSRKKGSWSSSVLAWSHSPSRRYIDDIYEDSGRDAEGLLWKKGGTDGKGFTWDILRFFVAKQLPDEAVCSLIQECSSSQTHGSRATLSLGDVVHLQSKALDRLLR